MLAAKLLIARALGVLICVLLTGAAMLVPDHPWLQLGASASCALFAWLYGVPVGEVIAQTLARMRPERLAAVLRRAADSMPPERAQLVMQSLQPPPPAGVSIPPVPIVFEGETEPPSVHSLDQLRAIGLDEGSVTDGWEASKTPAHRPPRKH